MLKDIQITDGVVRETRDDGTAYISPIEAYDAIEAETARIFIVSKVLDTNNPLSFEEKDRLFDCLKIIHEVIEREINDSAINAI